MTGLWQWVATNAPFLLAVVVVLAIAVFVTVVVRLMNRQQRRSLPHTVIVRRKATDDVCQMWPCINYAAAWGYKVYLVRHWDPRDYSFRIEPTGGAR